MQQSHHSSNTSTSDVHDCAKCGQTVESILTLQCEHNLCLNCSSKLLSKAKSQQSHSLRCEICGVVTVVDPKSVEILQNLNQNEGAYTSQIPLQQPTYNKTSNPKPQSQPEPMHSNYNSNHKQKQSYNQFYQYEEDIFSEVFREVPTFCKEHESEVAQLYCFTCQTPCICVECFINGIHKNHEVKNVQKSYESFGHHVEDLRFKIKARFDLLLADECKLTQKKREIIEVATQAKNAIKNNFDELLRVIEQKQKELMGQTEELMEEKFQEIDKSLTKVKHNMGTLKSYDEFLDKFYNNERRLENQIKAFNFYAENKVKILSQLQQMDQNFFLQIHDKLAFEFQLDASSVYQHIDSIKGVKFEVISLKGLESTQPLEIEKSLFEQAKEERQRRKFSNFYKENIKMSPLKQIQQHQPATNIYDEVLFDLKNYESKSDNKFRPGFTKETLPKQKTDKPFKDTQQVFTFESSSKVRSKENSTIDKIQALRKQINKIN